MAIYEERTFSWWQAALIISVAFMLIYSPWQLGERELYWNECDYACMAKEMNHFPPLTVIHGEMIPGTFPLFPVLAFYLNSSGFSMESCLRLLSVLSLLAIAVVVWEAGRRASDIQAAMVATVVMISSIIVIEKAIDGYPDMLGLFFLTCAWLSWFSVGAGKSNWSLAWIVALFFCGLSFYTIGWPVIFYFSFPLIFMRRPLTVWPKLRKSGFFIGVAVLLTFIIFWGVPRWLQGVDVPFRQPARFQSVDFSKYFVHILHFPFQVFFRFFPWTLLAWTPFCVAFHPLDKNPIFSRFLRTIFISLFFLLWFSPFTDPRDMVVLGPSIAIMTGINYWLLVRRYGYILQKLFRITSYGLTVGALGCVILFLLPVNWWDMHPLLNRFQVIFQDYWLSGFAYAIIALTLIGGGLLVDPQKLTVFWHGLLICVTTMLLYWSLLNPLKIHSRYEAGSRTAFGEAFRTAMKGDYSSDATVYKDSDITGLYGRCFYLRCNIRKIKSIEELPEAPETVYLIGLQLPIYPKRLWSKVAEQEYKNKKIFLYKGSKAKDLEKRNESRAKAPK